MIPERIIFVSRGITVSAFPDGLCCTQSDATHSVQVPATKTATGATLTLTDIAVNIVAASGVSGLEVLAASNSLAGEPWPSEVNGK